MSEVTAGNANLQLESALQKIASCVALIEEAVGKIETHEVITGKRLETSEAYFEKRLIEIKSLVSDLQQFMTQTGAARFRVAAEKALQEGRDHLSEIKRAIDHFQQLTENSCDRLERVAENSSNRIAESIQSLKINEFRRMTIEGTHRVEEASDGAIKRVTKLVRWLHWEKLGLAFVLAIVASVDTGLFITDEGPLESHKEVVAQRTAGKALLRAWPNLSTQEKAHIERQGSQFL